MIPSLDLALHYLPSQTAIHEQSDGYGIFLARARYRSIQVLAPVEFYLDREGAVFNCATEKNHHLINGDTLNLMKEGAMLINPSRGALIDKQAVIRYGRI